ncbi:MAG TPA: permease-like cell division protein FtsX [candidate division Zixibacteria bacterium]|nr:permease-like cell division protein FtsX [candidate division Zixibacteria bacterium]
MGFLRFIAFSVVRAWQGFWRNAMMSLAATATVILMLVLLSGLFIVIAGLNSGLEFIESKVGVTARLVGDLPESQRRIFLDYAESLDGVEKVVYVSPEMAMERLREYYRSLGQELELGGADIELYESVEISLLDPEYSGSVAAALEDRSEVERITTRQADYEKLLGIIGVIRTVGIVALALVGLTVLFMIVNTIRIAVYSRANEIEIMRLVGASDSFIRWPFILEGILCGLIGAVITVILVAVVWNPIQPIMVQVFQMPTTVSSQFLATLSGIVLAVGLAVGALGSWISVRSNLSAAA